MITKAEYLHELVWKRFIRMPYGHVLDYADAHSGNIYPTPEQCASDFPNPMGWWTCIENGAFFGGLYLAALIEKYKLFPDEDTKREIQILLNGLFLLQDISTVDGFIARGVGTDGKCHYKLSSEDQVGPWVYGLWKAYGSEAVSEDTRSDIASRIERQVQGLERNNFCIPTEWSGHTWGGLSGGDFRGCAKLLGCVRAAYEVTGKQKWLDLYEKLADEHPSCPFTRAEICSFGCAPDMVKNTGLIQFWIFACAHLFVKELAECDKKRSALYTQGVKNSAVSAIRFLDDYKIYLKEKKSDFDIDWTKVSHLYKKPENPLDGRKIALEENKFWMSEIVPARKAEHNILGNMLFACLMCAATDDQSIHTHTAQKALETIDSVPWDKLNLSYAFVAESIVYYIENNRNLPLS